MRSAAARSRRPLPSTIAGPVVSSVRSANSCSPASLPSSPASPPSSAPRLRTKPSTCSTPSCTARASRSRSAMAASEPIATRSCSPERRSTVGGVADGQPDQHHQLDVAQLGLQPGLEQQQRHRTSPARRAARPGCRTPARRPAPRPGSRSSPSPGRPPRTAPGSAPAGCVAITATVTTTSAIATEPPVWPPGAEVAVAGHRRPRDHHDEHGERAGLRGEVVQRPHQHHRGR